jgi:hypothetical protein
MEQKKATKVNVENQAAIAISNNPIFHGKTKHFKLKYYFLREVQKNEELQLIYCKTEDQLADMLTKPLSKTTFETLRKQKMQGGVLTVASFAAEEEVFDAEKI